MPFKKGVVTNPNGRPTKPEIQQLRDALARAKKKHGNVDLIDKFVELAYTDTDILKALMKKLLPDLKHTDLDAGIFVSGGMYLGHLSDEELDARIEKYTTQLAGIERAETGAKKKAVSSGNSKGGKKSKK